MPVDLFFRAPLRPGPPVDLIFGAEDTALPLPTVAFAAVLAPPTAAFTLQAQDNDLTFAAVLAPPTAAFAVNYSDGPPPAVSVTFGSPWQRATPDNPATALAYGEATAALATVALPWTAASPLERGTAMVWPPATPRERGLAAVRWAEATPRPARAVGNVLWDQTTPRSRVTAVPWDEAAPLGAARLRSPWQTATVIERRLVAPWGAGRPLDWDLRAVIGRTRPVTLRVVVPWGTGGQPRHGRSVIPPWDFPDPTLPPVETVVIPIQRVYMVTNSVSLIRLDTGAVLVASALQLSLDVDSWTWGFTASIRADQLSLVTPDADGTPVILAATINGSTFHLLAEGLARDRTFNSSVVRLSGRGRNALLDAPYALTQSFGNASDATALQLLDQALTENGTSIGWTVDAALLTDWLVPAGVWSYSGSYIGALQSIAGAAGAYLQPHPTDDVLRVLPRYPVAPWLWASTITPDFQLPADLATVEGITWTEKPRYNRVFVSGTGQGVLGQVTRDGTAGDVVAQMVTDPLITAADAARQRGLPVLADTGRQALVSLRTPVLPAMGVIAPGKFVRYVDGAVTRIGIVRSTAVDFGFPEVWQTIGVETHE